MSTTEEFVDESDVLAALGRNWGLVLFLGIMTLLLGIACVAWPNATLAVIGSLFGAYLLVSGIFSIVRAFSSNHDRALLIITGILSILLAMYCFKSLANSAQLLALFIGFAWLFRGIIELLIGIKAKGVDGRGWLISGGILMIIGALVIFFYPLGSLTTLIWISGIMLILLGISEIVGAFQMKGIQQARPLYEVAYTDAHKNELTNL